ncbi:BatA domain-containing protein [candidate division KSB1 bacterium]
MSFLNPGILYLLLLGAIPPIIHLISRRKKDVLKFSSIRFLKELEDSRIKKLKIKQILLLILRTLIIIFLVLGFSRPTIKGSLSSVVGQEKATSGLIFIDNSLSTNTYLKGKKVFDHLKESARTILPLINKFDDFYLAYIDNFDNKIKIESLKNEEYNFFLLNRIKNTSYKGNLNEILTNAAGFLFSQNNPNKEIFVLTDLQKSEFENIEQKDFENFQIFFIYPEENINNSGILSAEIDNIMFEPGKEVGILTRTGSFNNNSNGEILLSLFINGKRTAQRNLKVDPGKISEEEFKINIDNSGYIKGYFELEDDALEEDNRRYFSIKIPDKIKVLVINEDEQNPYLDAVLDANNIFETVHIRGMELVSTDLSKYDLIILDELSYTTNLSYTKIRNYLENRGNLLIIAGLNTNKDNFNNSIGNMLGLPKMAGQLNLNRESGEFVTFSKINFSHPVFKGLIEERDFTYPKLYSIPYFADVNIGENIISLSNNALFLHETKYSDSRILLLCSGINKTDSDFAFTGIFAPLIYRIVLYTGINSTGIETDKITGEELNLSFKTPNSNIAVKYPSGESVVMAPKTLNEKFFVNFNPSETGFYQLYAGNKIEREFYVNYNEQESNLEKADPERIENLFRGANSHFLKTDDNINNEVKKVRYGSEISTLMFIFVFVFIILEVILEWEKL